VKTVLVCLVISLTPNVCFAQSSQDALSLGEDVVESLVTFQEASDAVSESRKDKAANEIEGTLNRMSGYHRALGSWQR